MKKFLKIFQYIAFLGIGIFIFWYFYKDQDVSEYKEKLLHEVNYFWILVSVFIGLLSHVSRAIRWKMLILPLGYKPKTMNAFLSIMVMYLINFLIPRGGEVARCGVLTRYEKVPFTKLVGTVVVERITDFIALMVFAAIVLLSQVGVVATFFKNNPESMEKIHNIFSKTNIIISSVVFIVLVILFIVLKGKIVKILGPKLKSLLQSFIDGIKSIRQLEKPLAYIGHTVFIYFIWMISLFLVFFSFEPTASLSFMAGVTTLIMSGLAMVAPINAGMGAWHFMVAQTLIIYMVVPDDAKFFAFMAHMLTNLFLILVGVVALMILPGVNSKYTPDAVSEEEVS